MGDIRQSLLPRDVLSAAKELLYHLDIYISNLVQSGRQPPQVDTKTLELVEEFILHSPKDRNVQPRVSQACVCVLHSVRFGSDNHVLKISYFLFVLSMSSSSIVYSKSS